MSMEKPTTGVRTEENPRMFTREELSTASENLESFTTPKVESVPIEVAPKPEVVAAEKAQIADVKGRLAETAAMQSAPQNAEAAESPLMKATKEMMVAQKAALEKIRTGLATDPKELKKVEKRMNKAFDLLEKGKVNDKDDFYFGGVLRGVIASKINLMKANGDLEGMRKFAENNDFMAISPENVALLPKEVIDSPKVQGKIRARLEKKLFGASSFVDRSSTSAFSELASYEEMGILTPETLQSIAASPRTQKAIEKEVKGIFTRGWKGHASDPYGNARSMMEKYASAGLISRAKGEALLQRL